MSRAPDFRSAEAAFFSADIQSPLSAARSTQVFLAISASSMDFPLTPLRKWFW